MTWSAPAATAACAFAALLTVLITVASLQRASWMAALPTAPAPPATSTTRSCRVPGPSSRRPVLGHGQAAVRGEERDAQAGTEIERRLGRQPDDVTGRHHGELLGGAVGAPVGGLPDPHPLPDQRRVHPDPDRVHHAGAVLAGHLRWIDDGRPALLPRRDFQSVGFTPDRCTRILACPGPGSATGLVDEGEDVRIPGLGIHHGAHCPDGNRPAAR